MQTFLDGILDQSWNDVFDVVGARKSSAEGYSQYAGVYMEELETQMYLFLSKLC